MSVDTFKGYLKNNNIHDIEVVITTQPTRTAQEAADAHSVPVSNIVKSLLVKVHDRFEMHLVPGDRRLDIEKIMKKNSGSEVRMANAEEVKEITGYSIGGVPPFGHPNQLKTYIEEGFDPNIDLIAAAGSGNSVFRISLQRLEELTLN